MPTENLRSSFVICTALLESSESKTHLQGFMIHEIFSICHPPLLLQYVVTFLSDNAIEATPLASDQTQSEQNRNTPGNKELKLVMSDTEED